MEDQGASGALSGSGTPPETGPYILRTLADDLPLSTEEHTEKARITCVEVWNENLYIGTSAAELLHFVLIPPDPSDTSAQSSFILASRSQPPFSQATTANGSPSGVQQILLLPSVNKACILCNYTLTFYSLPELSPAFGTTKLSNCTWVGGVDQNLNFEDGSGGDGVVIMICLKNRVRLVRIGEEPRKVRDIEFGGCLATARRDDFACAADAHSYALLDVVHQRKITLSAISSMDEKASGAIAGAVEDITSPTASSISRSASAAGAQRAGAQPQGHNRATSLDMFARVQRRREESPFGRSPNRLSATIPELEGRSRSPLPSESPERQNSRGVSPAGAAMDKPLPAPPSEAEAAPAAPPPKPFEPLKPLVVSPTPNEFLFTTGTTPSEPGVGVFVNLDGDVSRGSLQFTTYPKALVVDGSGVDLTASMDASTATEEGYVLAVVDKPQNEASVQVVEILRWDLDGGESTGQKDWLSLPRAATQTEESGAESKTDDIGIRRVTAKTELSLTEVGEKLRSRKLDIQSSRSSAALNENAVRAREAQEADFGSRLCKVESDVVVWSSERIWWAVRNPLVLRLDSRLDLAVSTVAALEINEAGRGQIEYVVNSIRGQSPRTEVEFFSLNYIRQRASLLLLMDTIIRTFEGVVVFEADRRFTEEALAQSELDPRIVLSLLPVYRDEVVQSQKGIWVQSGVKVIYDAFVRHQSFSEIQVGADGLFGDNLLQLLKRYLMVWRQKKGFGSIEDEKEVSLTVDAALLRVLLLLDSQSPRGPATAGSIRAELNSFIDRGIDCFDRAVEILEEHHRLYLLSRLYQSSKQLPNRSSRVLATWKRIVDGEQDAGGEFLDGEQQLRRYLTKIRDSSLVEEYGAWLANRNPRLGVQIFADDSSMVKFQPAQAVALLKDKAPLAVKEYLEHLVFGKNLVQYANDLINFYLDTVLAELERSETARSILLNSYESYRALNPPKPTYREFITDNALDAEWWQNRLRLLQLLGGSHAATFKYDETKILGRVSAYTNELVPEMIILDGQQGRHEQAIKLLVHGLGDYDTAINYCLYGVSSIFRTSSGPIPNDRLPTKAQQMQLFGYLLTEFLNIEDLGDRIQRTSELLERFAGWFDVAYVLTVIPESWSVELLSGFLVHALRSLVHERDETSIAKALSGAQNLKVSSNLIEKMQELGSSVESAETVT